MFKKSKFGFTLCTQLICAVILQLTSPNVKKSAVTALMLRVIQLRDGSDN